MRRFNTIMESANPPGINQLWIDKGNVLRFFHNGKWYALNGSMLSIPSISENGTWIIDGIDTGYIALGTKGDKGDIGPTGLPAGFGNITTSTETLPSNRKAEVVITPSGSDDAKNFDFLFKIPRGKDGEGGGTDIYESHITNKSTIAAPSWTDIQGKKLSELEGLTFSELFDMIFFTTLYPSFVGPSVVISSTTGSSNRSVEVGSNAPTESQFNYLFNRGSITITYPDGTKDTSQGGRAGQETSHTYTVNGNESFPVTFDWGTYSYMIKVNYAQGPQPKDSKGNNYNSPLPAGYVTANYTVYAGYYYYAGVGVLNESTMKKSIIVSDTSSIDNSFSAEVDGRYTWWIPSKKRATKIEYFDTNSSNWIDDNLSTNWETSTMQINGVNYTKLTNKNPQKRGSLRLKVTLTNV